MSIHILYVTISATLTWQCTLKERRQQAQKLRDVLKNKYNASVKLDYSELASQFTLYFVALGETADHLQNQVDSLHTLMEEHSSLHYRLDSHIEQW